jgi:outer membrane lipoprotein carrier protein
MTRVASLLAALALASPVSANGDCAAETMARVQARYDSIRDLEARFEQTTRPVALGGSSLASGETSTGRVVFAKPGRMRWSYESPRESLVVSDGETLWLYDAEAKEAQRLPVDRGSLPGGALLFLMGEGDLAEAFRVESASCGGAIVELELTPREPARYERIGLRVRAETGDVVGTRVVDVLGNVTEISLRDVRTNQDPAPETFRFRAPDGVEVIELRNP